MKESEEGMMLSAQRALLQTIVPELRAVFLRFDHTAKIFSIIFFYDGAINGHLSNLTTCCMTEICSDLYEDYEIDETIERLDFPAPLPDEGRIVYRRYEPRETVDEPFVLLSAQQALLDKVTPQLRVVLFELAKEKKHLKIIFFYDGLITEESQDLAERTLLKIRADLPKGYQFEHELRRLDYPARIPFSGRVAYVRYEKVDELLS